ncbi:putative fatty acyl-CoA reductase CG5065 [Trichoplusia ni]|uniref:Fatty acyl-CoA reductase n=1 Tax=Trichoplusia ni TaxID=7111 RepID=A0A7E5WIT7_TRINI|nr:putative fatty acyl-CoA reductase CG5065 [Trichoplusia ni]XP_026740052.1 putative fatty acyl-CoA reductase CG5065 [Trichoplusia ni]
MAPTVPEFYAGKSVLITGGTGFVGKALLEKLLRCCPDIGTVYLLMRQKKGLGCEERLKDLWSKRVFDLLRDKDPEAIKKVRLINGDITEPELGISDADKKELQERCNVIFHSAACVRFDQKLKDAVNLNTTGTLRMLTLAESMKNLQVFVHLSTAYCRCDLEMLEEKLYPAVHNPRKIIEIVEWMDDDTLQYLEPKLISSEPNTYSYTKAITEDLVAEYSGKFPIAIARPSIVTAAWKEPIPGWVDNLNGPTGLVIGSGKGVIRTMHCEPSYTADAISVDVVVNACILIAYVTALDKPKTTQIYNLTLSKVFEMTWAEIIKLGEKFVNQFPYSVALWYPGGSIKSYKIAHQIDVFFSHILPAYLVDALLFLLGKKTFMINLQKRISHGLNVLQYYTTKEWDFRNENYKSLRNRVTAEDNETFFTDISSMNPEEYLKNYVLGTRQFCCHEDPANIPRARKLHTIRYIVDRFFKLVFIALIGWFLYSNRHIFSSSMEFLDSTLKSMTPLNPVKAEDEL